MCSKSKEQLREEQKWSGGITAQLDMCCNMREILFMGTTPSVSRYVYTPTYIEKGESAEIDGGIQRMMNVSGANSQEPNWVGCFLICRWKSDELPVNHSMHATQL